jgi:hypothetical protein
VQQIGALLPGQSLKLGDAIISNSGQYRLVLQHDGNPVILKNGVAIWSPGMHDRGAVRLSMQTDGNLVLYRGDGFPLFQTGTHGRPGSRLVMQDDGNLVVYERTTPYWDSRTWGGYYHEDEGFTFFNPFAESAEAMRVITANVAEIPLVGPALHGVFLIASGPFTFTDQVIKGERIDRALINDFKDKIAGIREIAPYAQAVISFVPGIGTGVSAAIGAGLALAAGRPIDEAIKEGVRSAIPGGPVAQAAFDLTFAAATGENIVEAAGATAIRALGLPPAAAQAAGKAFNVIYRAAQGENIPLALLNEARSYLPAGAAQRAFDVGLALAQGKRLQDAALEELVRLAPSQIQKIKDVATPVLAKIPALQVAKALIANPVLQSGYQLGMGLMSHSDVSAQAVQAVRSQLPPQEQQGFDLGVAAWRGIVARKPPASVAQDPSTLAGYVLVKGLATHPDPVFKKQVLAQIATNPKAKIGASYALKEQAAKEGFLAWLWRLVAG